MESDSESELGPRLNQVWMQATGLIETCDGTVVAVPLIRRFVGRAGRETGGPLFAAGEVMAEAVRDVQLLNVVGSVKELARVLSRMDRMPAWRG